MLLHKTHETVMGNLKSNMYYLLFKGKSFNIEFSVLNGDQGADVIL